MAFGLPYDKAAYSFDAKKKFGINVSSLLWDDNTRGRFGLSIDYKAFYRSLITYLIETGEYQVHIIPHVIDNKNYEAAENDYRVCCELEKEFKGHVILAPAFETAIQAKSYISNMDVFLGSRMHSTIGAISSGVATIPLSYAYKFEALYSHINYPYVINARKATTEEALKMTKQWASERDKLKETGEIAVSHALDELVDFKNDLKISLKNNDIL